MAPRAADSVRRVGNSREHTFATEDVIVVAPDQADGVEVRVQKDDLVPEPAMNQQSDFKPRRMVINLLLDKDHPGPGQPAMNPAVTIRVRVTDQDATNAGGRDKIKMAYWYQGKWIIFADKHGFTIQGNYAQASLAVWGDPPIGMGP